MAPAVLPEIQFWRLRPPRRPPLTIRLPRCSQAVLQFGPDYQDWPFVRQPSRQRCSAIAVQSKGTALQRSANVSSMGSK